MFYISSIFNVGIGNSIKRLNATHTATKYSFSCGKVYCNIEDLSKIQVGVYDTSDKTEEFYFVYDLLNVLAITDVKIEGIDIIYFSRTSRIPNNLDSIKSLGIKVALASTSEEFKGGIARLKLMSGVDISADGKLILDYSEDGYRILNEVFKNGDTIVFPDTVRTLTTEYNFKVNSKLWNVKKILVGCNLDLTDYNTARSLQLLKHYLLDGDYTEKYLIVDGDLRVNFRLFKSYTTNIYSRGTVTVSGFKNSLDRIKQDIENNGTNFNGYRDVSNTIPNLELSKIINKVFYIADSNYIYKIDFSTFSIERERNNGRLVL